MANIITNTPNTMISYYHNNESDFSTLQPITTANENNSITPEGFTESMDFDLSYLSPEIPVYMRVIGFIVCFTIITVGFLGNLTVLVSVVRYKFLQMPANIVIASMACVDMSHVIGVLWVDLMMYARGSWPFSNPKICAYQLLFFIFGAEVDLFHIFTITLYRYLSIVYPRLHNYIKGPAAWIVSFVILFIAPLILLIETSYKGVRIGFKYGGVAVFNTKQMVCNIIIPNYTPSNNWFGWVIVPLVFGAVCIMMYAHIYYVYRRSRNQVVQFQQAHNTTMSKKNIRGALQLMRIMLLIEGIYLITQLVPPLMNIGGHRGANYPWLIATIPVLMFWLRVSINWIIYGALNVNFRKAYTRMFKLGKWINIHSTSVRHTGMTVATV